MSAASSSTGPNAAGPETNRALADLGEYIASAMPVPGAACAFINGELVVTVPVESVCAALAFLRDNPSCLFKLLVDICGVDYPGRAQRFEVVYNLLSLRHNQRVRVKVSVDEATHVPSAVDLYSSAGWYEREAWDLYGIGFAGNPDLRRIMTDYGFEGHPLRKDFPLTGFVEVRYDEAQKRVVYEPVALTQDFRSFDFMSPWEGARQILPGDEKAGGPGGGG